jgi:Ca2+-binding RTX toxin-like protein
LTGTSAGDRITGFQGRDTISTGAGNDVIVYTRLRDARDTITDFQVGADKIDFTELFDNLSLGSLDYASATAGGYLRFTRGFDINDTNVLIDRDGSAGRAVGIPLILVQDVSQTALNNANNFLI